MPKGVEMSLFQCENCGCVENTALSCQGCIGFAESFFDWSGFEGRKGKKLCSVCGPTKMFDGTPSGLGAWHDQFKRVMLEPGTFKTNSVGNLEHIETGDTDFKKYELASKESK